MGKRVGGLLIVSGLQDELDRAFARAGELLGSDRHSADLAPPMDVIESDSSIVIVMEVAGLEVDDLVIEASGNRVTISGRRRGAETAAGPIRYFCMERGRGEFQRAVELVGAVDAHQANARLARGLLRIEIPKIADQRLTPRRIAIAAEE